MEIPKLQWFWTSCLGLDFNSKQLRDSFLLHRASLAYFPSKWPWDQGSQDKIKVKRIFLHMSLRPLLLNSSVLREFFHPSQVSKPLAMERLNLCWVPISTNSCHNAVYTFFFLMHIDAHFPASQSQVLCFKAMLFRGWVSASKSNDSLKTTDNSTSEYLLEGNENTNSKRYLCPHILCSIIYNSQDMEITVSTDG